MVRVADKSLSQLFADLRSDYDLARPSIYRRERTGMLLNGSNADYHYQSQVAYFRMVESAREIVRNNTLVAQGLRRFVANIVQGGFTLDPDTGDDALNDDLAERWEDYSGERSGETDQVDVAGELTWFDIECQTLFQVAMDGDHVVLMPTREPQLQCVESHRLRTPYASPSRPSSKRNVIHGVEIDGLRKRIGYWLTKDDVAVNQAVRLVGDMAIYPARDAEGHKQVLHLYRPDRRSQTRGVTALSTVADPAGMFDDLCFAQLVKAQSAACWTILRELALEAQPPDLATTKGEAGQVSRPDGTIQKIEGAVPGMQIFGFPGEKISGFSPNIPNAEFFQHATFILGTIAVNLDLPLAVFLLDPTKTNFSGWRGAMDQAKIRFQQFQRWYRQHLHSPVYAWKVRQWIAADPILARAATRDGIRIFRHSWHPPTWPYIEPMKDIGADAMEERTAMNSPRRIFARRSLNFRRVTVETVQDNAFRIRTAKTEAAKINDEFPKDDPIHWRELITLPLPDGMQIRLTGTDPSVGDKMDGDQGQDAKETAA